MRTVTKSITLTITRKTCQWGSAKAVFLIVGKDSHTGRGSVMQAISKAMRKAGV